MRLPDIAVFIGVIVLLWVLQLALSYRQAIGFSKRIAEMRRSGTVAVGLGQGRYRSRTYAVVAVGRDDRVLAAEVLKGWTTLSRPKPIPDLPGLPYERLCDTPAVATFDSALRAALCQVVTTLRKDRAAKQTAEGGAAIAQRA
ncbi:MAG TPA: transcriptional regulator GutM [Candidatus Limnocylindrales bacterium]|jgi:DNA-binding transcriptional regulator of glucitol operon